MTSNYCGGPASVCSFDCIDGTNEYLTFAIATEDYQRKPCDDGNHLNNDGCNQWC
jgi:hypothetical protein